MATFFSIIWNYLRKIRLADVIIFIVTVGILGWVIYGMAKKNSRLEESLEVANSNNAAYQMRIEGQQNKIIQFELTTEYLRHCNDSVPLKLTETMDKLKISEKKLQQANYMLTHISKTDTVYVPGDTIFKEPDFVMDTTVGDKWVSTRLEMSYPNKIVVTPSVTSEKEVFVYTHRETVNPPKKCFILRWFQKKHTVTRVEINEENPYIISQENVFIKTGD